MKQRRSECESQRWWNTPNKMVSSRHSQAGTHLDSRRPWRHAQDLYRFKLGQIPAQKRGMSVCVCVCVGGGVGIRNWLPSSYSHTQAPKCDSEAPLWPGSVTHFGQEMTVEVPLWQLWVYSLWNSVSMWPDWESLGKGWETTGSWRSRDRQRLEKLEWWPPSFVSPYPDLWTLQITYR